MALARAKAPADPNARHRLVLLLGAEQLAEAEAQILQAHPHLSRERDGALISSLTTLNMVCRTAWAVFGSGTARLGYATRAGKLSWNRGLTTLLNLEAARMKLANELAITPQSKRQLGLSVEVGEGSEVVVIAGDTQEYINKLRALRGAPPLPLPETIAVPDHSTSALAFYGKKPEGEA